MKKMGVRSLNSIKSWEALIGFGIFIALFSKEIDAALARRLKGRGGEKGQIRWSLIAAGVFVVIGFLGMIISQML